MGLLRVLLALSVAISHFGSYYLAGGFAAVQVFYIISGFYMATVLTEKYDPRRDIGIFFTNRFLRIYSIYYLCLLISLAGYALIYISGQGGWIAYVKEVGSGLGWAGKAWLIFSGLFIFGQESTLFMKLDGGQLLYAPDGPTAIWQIMPVPQAWSVSLELMFYCLVPFLIRTKTTTLIAIIAATLVLRAAVYHAGYEIDPWMSRFFPMELGLFVLGMVARRVYDAYTGRIGRNIQLGIVGAFFVVTCVLQQLLYAAMIHKISISYVIWPYYFSALIVLPCLFQLTRYSKIDGAIGNFSYPFYMIHWIVLKVYEAFADRFHWPGPETWGKTLSCVVVTFFLSWLIVIGVETPLDRYRHRRSRMALAANQALAVT